jgi:predicted DNA-binding ribbon-helix-helix protein
MSLVGKRSVVVWGHKTSVSLEPDFWRCLTSIARDAGRPIANLIEEVDHNRRYGPQEERNTNLSSALRVFVLKHFVGEGHGTRPGA